MQSAKYIVVVNPNIKPSLHKNESSKLETTLGNPNFSENIQSQLMRRKYEKESQNMQNENNDEPAMTTEAVAVVNGSAGGGEYGGPASVAEGIRFEGFFFPTETGYGTERLGLQFVLVSPLLSVSAC